MTFTIIAWKNALLYFKITHTNKVHKFWENQSDTVDALKVYLRLFRFSTVFMFNMYVFGSQQLLNYLGFKAVVLFVPLFLYEGSHVVILPEGQGELAGCGRRGPGR